MKLEKENNSDKELQVFLNACMGLKKELLRYNIEVDAFSSLSKDKALLTEGLSDLKACIVSETNRMSEISSKYDTAEHEVKNIWGFLKKNKFKFSKDLFDLIKEDHFIEVYDSSFRAIYRDPNTYRNTSYSIADLYLYPWNDLYGRDDKYNIAIAEKVVEAFYSEKTSIIEVGVGPHECFERFSKKMLVATTHPHFFAPIQSEEGLRAVMTVNSIINIESRLVSK